MMVRTNSRGAGKTSEYIEYLQSRITKLEAENERLKKLLKEKT